MMGTNTPTFYTIKQHAIGYGFWSVPNLLEIYVIEKLMFFSWSTSQTIMIALTHKNLSATTQPTGS